MRLLEQIASSETAATGVLAAHNSYHFARYGSQQTGARRVAAGSLLLLNAAIAAEAALYLAFLPAGRSAFEGAAVVVVRTLVLAGVAAISALVLRREAARRGGPR